MPLPLYVAFQIVLYSLVLREPVVELFRTFFRNISLLKAETEMPAAEAQLPLRLKTQPQASYRSVNYLLNIHLPLQSFLFSFTFYEMTYCHYRMVYIIIGALKTSSLF